MNTKARPKSRGKLESSCFHAFYTLQWGVWCFWLTQSPHQVPAPHNKVAHISYSPSPAIINLWSPLTLAYVALSLSHVWLSKKPSLNEELLGLGVPRRGLLLVVDVEAYGLVRVDAQSLLDHLSYPSDPVGLTSVSEPHSQLVSLGSHIHHCSVHLKQQGSLSKTELVSIFWYQMSRCAFECGRIKMSIKNCHRHWIWVQINFNLDILNIASTFIYIH